MDVCVPSICCPRGNLIYNSAMQRRALIGMSVLAWACIAGWVISGFGWFLGAAVMIGLVAFCWLVATMPGEAKK